MEKLKELLGEELYKSVVEKLGTDKKYTFGLEENYVTKDRFNQLNEQVKDYKTQLSDRDKQLEDLKKASEGNEELSKKLAEMEENNKKIQTEYETKLLNSQRDYAVDLAITKAKAKNPKALKALLDLDKVKYEDGKVSGLEEQLKAIKESDGYLFEDDVPTGTGLGDKGKKTDDEEFTKEQAMRIRNGLF